MSKSKEKRYELTAKGIILSIVKKEQLATQIYNELELYGLRHFSKDGMPAILLTPNGGSFTTVEKQKKKGK